MIQKAFFYMAQHVLKNSALATITTLFQEPGVQALSATWLWAAGLLQG